MPDPVVGLAGCGHIRPLPFFPLAGPRRTPLHPPPEIFFEGGWFATESGFIGPITCPYRTGAPITLDAADVLQRYRAIAGLDDVDDVDACNHSARGGTGRAL